MELYHTNNYMPVLIKEVLVKNISLSSKLFLKNSDTKHFICHDILRNTYWKSFFCIGMLNSYLMTSVTLFTDF